MYFLVGLRKDGNWTIREDNSILLPDGKRCRGWEDKADRARALIRNCKSCGGVSGILVPFRTPLRLLVFHES